MTERGEPVLATAFADADQSPGLLLWRVTHEWQAAMRAALRPYDLTHVQYVLLASLTWLQSAEPVTQQRLADHARTDPMMTSQVLRALETKGLVERRPHPADGRARSLHVTQRGVDVANRATAAVENTDREWFAAIGDDLPGFVRALQALTGRR